MKYCIKLGIDIFTVYIHNNTGNIYGDAIAKLFNLEMSVFLKHFDPDIEKKDNYTIFYVSFDQILTICNKIKTAIKTNELSEEITTSIERIDLIEEFVKKNNIIVFNDEIFTKQLKKYLQKIKFAWKFVENHKEKLNTIEVQRYVTNKYDEFFSYED